MTNLNPINVLAIETIAPVVVDHLMDYVQDVVLGETKSGDDCDWDLVLEMIGNVQSEDWIKSWFEDAYQDLGPTQGWAIEYVKQLSKDVAKKARPTIAYQMTRKTIEGWS